MRTKALFLTAAIGAAGIATSMAQVYSVNAVGYVNVSITNQSLVNPTYAILANPLKGTDNTLSTILPVMPEFTTVYVFRGTPPTYVSSLFLGGAWTDPTISIAPGEGFFIALDTAVPGPTTITFVGEVEQGNLTNTLPAGFSMRSSIVPQAGGATSPLGLNPGEFDTLYIFDRVAQTYISYLFLGGAWIPSEPVLGVAEGFFYQNSSDPAAPLNWGRSFNVN